MPNQPQIIYEHPLNERMRVFLRFHFLCKQARAAMDSDSDWANRICIQYLLETLDILSRTNLKKEIIQALECHLNRFSRLNENPNVDLKHLNTILDQLDELIELLHSDSTPIGNNLRHIGLFLSMRQRAMIAGGSSELDLPELHYWMHQPSKKRGATLSHWIRDLSTAEKAVSMIIDLTRSSTEASQERAVKGFFHCSLPGISNIQMVRIAIDKDIPVYPEISGGSHRVAIRMVQPSADAGRPKPAEQDIPFNFTRCTM